MSEYATSADICNKALQELGCVLIGSLTDNSRNAAQCSFLYDKTRQALLREHIWGFAISYATLASPVTTRTYQNGVKRNAFTLPAGFVRFAFQDPRTAGNVTQATTGGIKFTDYQLEGGQLVTANAGPIQLRYASDVTNVALMDPLFCDALAARMEVDGLAETLTGSAVKRQLAQQRYDARIEMAKLIQLIESAGDEPTEQAVKTARILEQPPAPQPLPQGRGR